MKHFGKNNTNVSSVYVLSIFYFYFLMRKTTLALQFTPRGLSSTWDLLPGGVLFPPLIASLCFSSNAPFRSGSILTNEQRSEWRGCSYCTTHPVPFTSPCPAAVHLPSLLPFPHSKPQRLPINVKQVQHTLNTYLLMHVHVDM